jgi:hypothetical protein
VTASPHSLTVSTPVSAATPAPAPTQPAGSAFLNTRPSPPSRFGDPAIPDALECHPSILPVAASLQSTQGTSTRAHYRKSSRRSCDDPQGAHNPR